jgi:rifampicin phosphotransferase
LPILRLHEIAASDRTRVGGKAFVLSRLLAQGFAVPDGFVFCTGSAWDATSRGEVANAYRALGGAVAVRSSSLAEDLEEASFAGQYATFLDLRDEAAVLDAVDRCLVSARSGEAYAALLARAGDAGMAVLVQRFVEPRNAGVAFTHHPGDPSALLVESHAGRGEALVSGRVTPARQVVDRVSGRLREASGPHPLGTSDLDAVVALARNAETFLGGPQDVEWAIGDAGLVVLQSRPITVAADATDPRARRLTRANVGEVLPDPVTPLTWSGVCTLLEGGFQAVAREAGLLPDDLAGGSFLVLHHRRVYLNLSLCIDVGRRLPVISPGDAERLVLGAGASGGTVLPAPPLLALPWLARVVARLIGVQARLPRDIAAARVVVGQLPTAERIASASCAELRALVSAFIATGQGVARAHIAASGSSAVRLALLTRVAAWLPGDPADLVNRLVAGLPDIESAAPTLALEEIAQQARARPEWNALLADAAAAAGAFSAGALLPELQESLTTLLSRYGHRAVSEGELAAASWEDDPMPVFLALQTLIRGGRPAGFGHRARATERRADEETARYRLGGWKNAVFAWALLGAQTWVREREGTKSLAIALVAHARRLARAAARQLVRQGRLAAVEDVFLLSLGELEAALAGATPSAAELSRRRRRQAREAALRAPREVDLDGPEETGAVSESWQGLGASPGVGIGRARVIRAGEVARLEPGEVLVAPVLDAALGPLLASAAGAVAEIGGTLSHGSVVARELGVPCVVDLRDATRRIRTGDRLQVDGGRGRVLLLADTPATAAEGAQATALPLADPADERLHPFVAHRSARESVYFNAYDPRAGIGIIASMGVRPGGRGEAVLGIALPDGRSLFGLFLARAESDARHFAVGGVGTSWGTTRLFFRGRLAPWESARFPPPPLPLLIAPRTVDVDLQVLLHPATPAVDLVAGLAAEERGFVAPLGAHHVEQSGLFRGHLTIDGVRHELEASGSRDHSWGRREWPAADHWKLFTVRFDDDLALHALTTSVLGRRVAGGFLWRSGELVPLTRVECAHEPEAASFELQVQTRTGERLAFEGVIERALRVPVEMARRPRPHLAGRPWAFVLRENFTRYTGDGRLGFGVAEFAERG